MVTFDHKSKFNKDARFNSLVFGSDAPLLETELMEMQDIQNEARAEILRQAVPSGFLRMTPLVPTINTGGYSNDIAVLGNYIGKGDIRNYFSLGKYGALPPEIAVVNGQILKLQHSNVWDDEGKGLGFQLGEPPTKDFVSCTGKKGYRDDLVFLEAWKEEVTCDDTIDKYGGEGCGSVVNKIKDARVGAETTRRVQWKWRIRVVDDVNFDKYPEGLGSYGESTPPEVTAQGGNESPLINTDGNWTNGMFFKNGKTVNGHAGIPSPQQNDNGLYIAGKGDQASKDLLKTVDGYVYAIPMFRVKRRNSGEYSVDNPNGARKCSNMSKRYEFASEDSRIPTGGTFELTLESVDYEKFKVGDVIIHQSSPQYKYKVLEKKSNNRVMLKNIGMPDYSITSNYGLLPQCSRPDELFNDIIDARDVTDLRHKVSLTGFNYDKLLAENFDSYMRGEMGKKKTVKTYHGVRKTPIDSHTKFYASLDGTTTAEVGGVLNNAGGNEIFKPSPTGLGLELSKNSDSDYHANVPISNVFTIDMQIQDASKLFSTSGVGIFALKDSDGKYAVRCRTFTELNTLQITFVGDLNDSSTNTISVDRKLIPNKAFIRIVFDRGTCRVYINGIMIRDVADMTIKSLCTSIDRIVLGSYSWGTSHSGSQSEVVMSDFSISDTDRGDVFATLPNDFITGYAEIAPAFNHQRQVFSEAVTSQVTVDIVKATGGNPAHIETIQSTEGQWTAGDTIKLKGLAGEIISGIIDSDTALTRITSAIVKGVMTVEDTTGIAVGDKVEIYDGNKKVWANKLIQSIDAPSKTVVLTDTGLSVNIKANGYTLVESTTSSSNIGVGGHIGYRIAGLGTSEVVITIESVTAGKETTDVRLSYSLNMIAGQGEIEVLERVLEGEANGQRLIEGTVAVIDDFAEKVTASTVVNPHTCKLKLADTLAKPTDGALSEADQIAYDKIESLDGNSLMTTTNISGQMAQQLISFDMITMVEAKYGEIPYPDKIQWLKDHLKKITCRLHGHGSCPSGNKVTFNMYDFNDNDYDHAGSTIKTSDASSVTEIVIVTSSGIPSRFDSEGRIHTIVYTDASDGATPSSINTDYVSIEIEFKEKASYTMLVPENPRRDAGRTNILLVRPEIRALETYFRADHMDGIALIGEYIPPAEKAPKKRVTVLAEGDRILLSDLATSACEKQGAHHYKNPLYRVRNDNPLALGEFGFGGVSYSEDTKDANTGAQIDIADYGFNMHYTKQHGLSVIQKPMVAIARYLVLHDGELKLLIVSDFTRDGNIAINSSCVAQLIPLQGKPLVKESKGKERHYIDPKAWKTSDGEIVGYLNEEGEVIATYQ